jgi:hypothetical protein
VLSKQQDINSAYWSRKKIITSAGAVKLIQDTTLDLKQLAMPCARIIII